MLSVKRHPCSYNGKKFAVVWRILTLQFKAVEEEKSLLHIKNVKTDECEVKPGEKLLTQNSSICGKGNCVVKCKRARQRERRIREKKTKREEKRYKRNKQCEREKR
jgi:hypothetical protein